LYKSGMPTSGQGRDCFGLVGKDRIRISKLPWLAWLSEKYGRAAPDPEEPVQGGIAPSKPVDERWREAQEAPGFNAGGASPGRLAA
jgi:hypothetical protein